MLNLQKIISDIDEEKFEKLVQKLEKSGGNKFLLLLNLYKQNNLSEKEIIEQLNISSQAFYTLRSRLYTKISYLITDELNIEKETVLKEYYQLEREFFNQERNQYINKLLSLEHRLKKIGFNHEILFVYSLLKRLNTHNTNYYNYSKQYNIHLASFIAVEKANEILCEYNKKLLASFYSYDEQINQELEFLLLEIEEYNKLNNENSIIQLIYNIILIQNYLYIQISKRGEADKHIKNSHEIIERLPQTSFYKTWKSLIDYFMYEQLFHQKNYSEAHKLFVILESNLTHILNFNIFSTSSNYLISRLLFIKTAVHHDSFDTLNPIIITDNDFLPNVNFYVHELYLDVFNKNYKESSTKVSKLLNLHEISSYKILQCELKILLAFINYKLKNHDFADTMLNNVMRALANIKNERVLYLNYLSKTIMYFHRSNNKNGYLKKAKEFHLLCNSVLVPFSILSPISNEIKLNLN